MKFSTQRANRRAVLALFASAAGSAVLLTGCSGDAKKPAASATTEASKSATPTETATPTPTVTTPPPGPLVKWPDNTKVSHIFFHSLAINSHVAFNAPNGKGAGYLDYMVSKVEFEKMLQQIYDKGWVLISPHDLYDVAPDGTMVAKDLMLPEGKKPLQLSIDDTSYYEFMDNDGFATKLLINSAGDVVNEYKDPETGQVSQGAYDVMPIVDAFVKQHPDFSHNGAKGIMALTGYNGVLGYRTSMREYGTKNPNIQQDIATAKTVAEAMKKNGWLFASHSWGHVNTTKDSLGKFTADANLWDAEVRPILGDTDLFIYPFGADISGIPAYNAATNPKYALLKQRGFKFFFGVDGSTPAWGQLGQDYLRQNRINIDGISLQAAVKGRPVLGNFFDPATVLDPNRPATIAGVGGAAPGGG